MKKISFLVALLFVLASAQAQKINFDKIFKDVESQTRLLLQNIPLAKNGNADLVSPRTVENGKLELVKSSDWTSGFFPGELWYLYEYTKNTVWKQKADTFTLLIEKEKLNGGTHDMGFKIYCSFGNGYRLTNNPHYKEVIILSAKTLSTRFNEKIGAIRSWDHNRQKWQFPVIIDNMMNLELLFAATRLTGDSSFYKIAVAHANTTLKNHFRADNSSYHVVGYDTASGAVIQKNTHQGFSDASAWARGQAWALYGYTLCYRETKDVKYLQQAEKVAAFILKHPRMPKDLIPYWDFDDPKIPNASRDASATAIVASALYELSGYTKASKKYRATADKIIYNLTKSYRSPLGQNKGFILIHSTGHAPKNSEIDVPINYADYYYLEALLRSKRK